MFCTQCRAELPKGARFCPQCRAKVPVELESFSEDKTVVMQAQPQRETPQRTSAYQTDQASAQAGQQMTEAMSAQEIVSARSFSREPQGHVGAPLQSQSGHEGVQDSQERTMTQAYEEERLKAAADMQTALNTLVLPNAPSASDQPSSSLGFDQEAFNQPTAQPPMDKTMAIPVVKQQVNPPGQPLGQSENNRSKKFIIVASVLGLLILVLACALGYFGYQAYVQHEEARIEQEAAALKNADDKEKSKKEKEAQEQAKSEQKSADQKAAQTDAHQKEKDAAQNKQQSYDTLNTYYETLGTQSSNIANFATTFNAVLDKGKGERGDLLGKMKDYRRAMQKDKDALQAYQVDSSYSDTKDKLLTLTSYNERRIDIIIEALDRSMSYSDPSGHHDIILEPIAQEQRAGSTKPESLIRFEDEYPGARPAKL